MTKASSHILNQAKLPRSVEELPRVIPVFPLAGALLLPQGRLPLNIFEPRYLKMVDDALAGDSLIGMVQPTGSQDGPGEPELYDTGCLGQISEHERTDDGRILITLTGVCRYTMIEELAHTTPYRKVVAAYDHFVADCDKEADKTVINRSLFIDRVKAYLGARGLSSDWKTIEDVPDDALVNALAMLCPFEPREKQALLEAETLARRADVMTAIIDFSLAQPEPPRHTH